MSCSLYSLPRLGVRLTGAARSAVRGDTADRDEREEGAGEGSLSSWVGVGGLCTVGDIRLLVTVCMGGWRDDRRGGPDDKRIEEEDRGAEESLREVEERGAEEESRKAVAMDLITS